MRTTSRHRLAGLAAVTLGAVLLLPVPLAAAAPTPQPSAANDSGKSGAEERDSATTNKKLQTFGIGPARASGIDGRPNFVYASKPGTRVEDQFALVNYTLKPVKVRVYAKDAFTSGTGEFGILEASKTSTDLGAWVQLKPRNVTIPARTSLTSGPGTVVIPFTVAVPKDASPGDHAAAIVASSRTDASQSANSVVVDRRVGTRLYLRVAGPLDPRLNLANLSVSYDGTPHPVGKGLTRIAYTVRNTGNVVLSARQDVQVDGWLGLGTARPATQQADLVQLLPGAAVKVTVDVKGVLPTFRPAAVVTLTPYSGTPDAPTYLSPVSASKSFWAIPWSLIAIVVALVLTFLGWQYWRRRRSRQVGSHRAPDPQPVLVSAP